MTDPQTPDDSTARISRAAERTARSSVTRVTSSNPVRVLQVDRASLADAVAILRAGIREDEPAALAIVNQVDPRELCKWLAYLADYYGKHAYGSAEALDEALSAWQRGGIMPLPE